MVAVAQTASCDTTIHSENFSLRVGSTSGINLRSERNLDARTSQNVDYNQMVDFDGWGYGQSVNDLWTGKPDALWYKLKDQNLWVPSAYMAGYPPSNPPAEPTCNSESPLFPNPTSSNPLRGFRHPMNGTGNYSATHDSPQQYADDLGVEIGTDVYAMRSGKVIKVEQGFADMSPNQQGSQADQFNVNYILIEHDTDVSHESGKPYRSMYMHIMQNSAVVQEGDRVTVGQLIAQSGHNGWSTGPHLHVEVNYSKGSGVFQRQTVAYVWDEPFDYNK